MSTLRTDVFVSYSHKDVRWLNRLQVHLKPLTREGKVEIWNDTLLQSGTKWQETIRHALTRAKVAVLLVTADFMASDFIAYDELPTLLVAAETEGAIILPVIISPSWFEKTSLARFQAVNPPSKPLIRMSKARQEEVWLKVAEEIFNALSKNDELSNAPKISKALPPNYPWTVPAIKESTHPNSSNLKDQSIFGFEIDGSGSRKVERLNELEASRLRSAYEVLLTMVKGYRRGWEAPRCYVSQLPEQASWTRRLIKDLRDAGVFVVEQAAHVKPDDFILVLDTPAYQKAFKVEASVLAADIPLINERLGKHQLISLELTGRDGRHKFEDCTLGSFGDETHYPVSLFDLVLNLYSIPLTHAGFAPLRQTLHTQWEETLAHTELDHDTSPLKIFISYSHRDEKFKDELVRMLAGLQRRGIVDTWQDRRIKPGDEWNKSIQDAMNECDLALLLVSPDYIASSFIQQVEQPTLLQRREDMQTRVIPIIVRPCKWQSEPVLKDLQALPKNGKAVISFPKATGARDQVWTDIGTAIEERAEMRKRK